MTETTQGLAVAASGVGGSPSSARAAPPPAGAIARRETSFTEIERMADAVAKSGFFAGMRSKEQVITLMLLAQSEGLHPMQAARRYDVLPNGKVGMKSEAMLAEFHARGGRVKWLRMDAEECRAIFYSPGTVDGLEVAWTLEDARRAKLAGKDNWVHYSTDMLRARCITRGVKATLPAAGLGMYPSEVAADFEEPPQAPVKTEAEILASTSLDVEEKPLGELLEKAEANRAALAEKYAPSAPEGPEEPTGKASPLFPTAEMTCAKDGCHSGLRLYASTSKKHAGRKYWQCEAAHDLVMQLMSEGQTSVQAAVAVKDHYREWAE